MDNMLKWRKENAKRYEFYFNTGTDKELVEWFEKIANKRQYVIELIRRDFENRYKTDKEN